MCEYVTIAFTVPESHADRVREAMGVAGGGQVGDYSFCSFSSKGICRFKPEMGANPAMGQVGVLETLVEEKIETICHKEKLERVIEAIKKAHPYEEMSIDIFPVYELGMKRAKPKK